MSSKTSVSTRLAVLFLAMVVAVDGQSVPSAAGSPGLTVTGDVTNPLTLSRQDLAAYPRKVVTVHERNGTAAAYEGVPLIEILKKAGVPTGEALRGKALASYLLASAHDSYQVTFALAELDPAIGSGDVIVADQRDGQSLPDREGPLRMVAPSDKKPARSVRMLERLEIVMLRKEPQGTR